MNPWLRPSMQQPRIISNLIKGAFTPLVATLELMKSYWSTWHSVYKPEKKETNYMKEIQN